jgi:hypothetical protein
MWRSTCRSRAARSQPNSSSAEPPRPSNAAPRHGVLHACGGTPDIRVSRSQSAPLGLDAQTMMEARTA